MQTSEPGRPLRADAVANRETLLAAAEKVFSEHGAAAPLALVIAESGLGRGTLYRHFPNRTALVAAMYDTRLDRYESLVDKHAADGTALHRILQMIAWDQYKVPGLLKEIERGASGSEEYDHFWKRTESLIKKALTVARKKGSVRDDVTMQDVYLAIAMFYGVANAPPAERWREEAITRSLELMHRTLSDRGQNEHLP